jgi:hypothetical protein
MRTAHRSRRSITPRSAFAGFRFPVDVHRARGPLVPAQNLRRGHYELAVTEPTNRRVEVAFDELVLAI